jgi:hypothetical protein
MGALTMSAACAELEHGAAAGDVSRACKRMPEIRMMFDVVTKAMTGLLPNTVSSDS